MNIRKFKKILPSNLLHQKQTQRHHDHAGHHPQNAVVAFAVGAAGGQEFIEAYINHDARNTAEQNARHMRRYVPSTAP